MKLLSWNVNGRIGAAAQRQIEKVLEQKPDVVALQELRRNSYDPWVSALTARAYSVVSTIDLLEAPYPGGRTKRTYFNLTAARGPIASLPGLTFAKETERRVAFPEKYLAVRVKVRGRDVEVHNAHLPPGVTRGMIKVHAFEAIKRRIDRPPHNARILCGDFNAPWEERADGPVDNEGWSSRPKAQRDRWKVAEKELLGALPDAYRVTHPGVDKFPASHFTGRTARRYDHVFASSDLRPISCEYLSKLIPKFSDHAPVVARFSFVSAPRAS